MVWPSTLKVSSDHSASRVSARSTAAAATASPPLASMPASPAACSSSRLTLAPDSIAMISITRVHMPA